MKIIDTDKNRMIALPGVGPRPRPVDIDERVTGFKTLKSLRIYDFDPNIEIAGESESDEVYIIPVTGEINMNITGAHPLSARLSPQGNRALYMPPDHSYRLTPQEKTLVAYARATANGKEVTHISEGDRSSSAEKLSYLLGNIEDNNSLPHDPTKERLIYVITGALNVDDQSVSATQTLALAANETANIRTNGRSSVLIIIA